MNAGWIACIAVILLNILFYVIWKPYVSGYAEEKGKRLATKEDIENVIVQVRAVTHETESIRTEMQSGMWERQTGWNQKRDIYGGLLKAIGDLEMVNVKIFSLTRGPLQVRSPEELDRNMQEVTSAATELRRWYSLGLIFIEPEACELVKSFIENPDGGLERPDERAVKTIENLDKLRIAIVNTAQRDLGLRRRN